MLWYIHTQSYSIKGYCLTISKSYRIIVKYNEQKKLQQNKLFPRMPRNNFGRSPLAHSLLDPRRQKNLYLDK